jgi:hypothetical protein
VKPAVVQAARATGAAPHNEDGKPTGATARLAADEGPRRVASRLRLEAWTRVRGEGNFNRRLTYPRLGLA